MSNDERKSFPAVCNPNLYIRLHEALLASVLSYSFQLIQRTDRYTPDIQNFRDTVVGRGYHFIIMDSLFIELEEVVENDMFVSAFRKITKSDY
jgi:hypothetical protein